MSLPRQVIAGRVYMVSRRCTQRQFLLRPDQETTDAFIYCLGVASARFNVRVIFFIAMSNHHHLGIIDVDGRLPEFMAYFHKLVAKHGNCLRGRWENFWAAEHASAVELTTSNDILDKMIYALTNPVKDHLVAKAHHWPGASSLRATLSGRKMVRARPRRFFRVDGEMPPTATLTLYRPPGLEHVSPEKFVETLSSRIADREASAAKERTNSGRSLLGRKAVLGQDWRARPATREPRRRLSPRIACRDKWRRIESLARNRAFLDAYRNAREAWVNGASAIFPAGTFWLRKFASVLVHPDSADAPPSSIPALTTPGGFAWQ
jgi:putative transposase